MCYAVILSTTSGDNLSQLNDDAIRFDSNVPDRLSSAGLQYSNKWYVGSRTVCSCSFRHVPDPEIGFSVPEEWYPENEADINATLLFIRLIRSLVAQGDRVDCIDFWEGSGNEPRSMILMPVDLSQIRDEEFRFFENHHFDFIERAR